MVAPKLLPSQLSLIEHKVDNVIIAQRPMDGYINATSMCNKVEKSFKAYHDDELTKAYLNELCSTINIPITTLIETIRGEDTQEPQETWVHPKVAIHLASWLSPAFAVQVIEWVFSWMNGKTSGFMPPHVKRYMANRAKIPPTHFSMLNEIYLHLLAPLEESGYSIPDKMLPDISTGKMFSSFLRRQGIDVGSFHHYEHDFEDTNDKRPIVQARLYPIEHLPAFRNYFHSVWLPDRAVNYFEKHDLKAVPHIKQIIAALPAPSEKEDK